MPLWYMYYRENAAGAGADPKAKPEQKVDPFFFDLETFEEKIAGGEEAAWKALEKLRPTGMPDTVAELSSWGSCSENEPEPAPQPKPVPQGARDVSDEEWKPITAIGGDRKTGRNNRCPCGSGKKYKQCCLRKRVG